MRMILLGLLLALNASAVTSVDGTLTPTSNLAVAEVSKFTARAETSTAQATEITAVTDTSAKEVTVISALRDYATSLASKYFFLSSPSANYYVWYKVGSVGVDPAITGATGYEVDLVANDSSGTVATKTVAVLDPTAQWVATATGSTFQVTNAKYGQTKDSYDGNTGFGFSVNTQGKDGYNNRYLLLNGASNLVKYYAWFNVSTSGTDPLVTGRTAIPVAIASGANASTIGTALASAIDATPEFVSTSNTGVVTVTNAAAGLSDPIVNGAKPTPMSIVITVPSAGSNLNSKYFLFPTCTHSYYVWFNVDGAGVDPALAGKTSVPIAATIGESANTLAAALNATLDALSDVSSGVSSNIVTATNDAGCKTSGAYDVNSGIGVNRFTRGTDANPEVVAAFDCSQLSNMTIVAYTTVNVTGNRVLTLETSPVTSGAVWAATAVTLTPNTTAGNGVSVNSSAFAGARCRVTAPGNLTSGSVSVYVSGR